MTNKLYIFIFSEYVTILYLLKFDKKKKKCYKNAIIKI